MLFVFVCILADYHSMAAPRLGGGSRLENEMDSVTRSGLAMGYAIFFIPLLLLTFSIFLILPSAISAAFRPITIKPGCKRPSFVLFMAWFILIRNVIFPLLVAWGGFTNWPDLLNGFNVSKAVDIGSIVLVACLAGALLKMRTVAVYFAATACIIGTLSVVWAMAHWKRFEASDVVGGLLLIASPALYGCLWTYSLKLRKIGLLN